MTSPQEIFARHLPDRLTFQAPSNCYAPSNIALSKYWGKRDQSLNLPLNSSLSISLRDWGTTTSVAPSEDGQDHVRLNGEALSLETPFAKKVIAFLDLFRRGQNLPAVIDTVNTIPTAAGLASSASGFAALTRAIDASFGLTLPLPVQSQLARLGSGSATRSFWHGFVRWDKGEAADGSDSFAAPLDVTWPEFRIAIVPVDTGPKSQSSRDGMNHTVATSPLFEAWPERAQQDCGAIEAAVFEQNFTTLGELAEANALAMHATMMAARPALIYLKPDSWRVLEAVRAARAEGIQVYATMDAGANVKLITLAQHEAQIKARFPQADMIAPFDPI